ncbi:unnamed protein product [Toxocara canis]|uniref:Uncharacterized protein n=1 Tax=Toxocara canis TaxID=6265 RepID=A0A183TV78_TOXCA|nr:unnamed protein product [Toxocara canis]
MNNTILLQDKQTLWHRRSAVNWNDGDRALMLPSYLMNQHGNRQATYMTGGHFPSRNITPLHWSYGTSGANMGASYAGQQQMLSGNPGALSASGASFGMNGVEQLQHYNAGRMGAKVDAQFHIGDDVKLFSGLQSQLNKYSDASGSSGISNDGKCNFRACSEILESKNSRY